MNAVISTPLARKSARNPRVLTIVVSSGFVLTGVVTTFLGPILPMLSDRWGLSDSRSGYFFATQYLGSFLGVILSSIFLPRRGYRFSLGLAYLLMALGVWGLALPQWKIALLGTFIFGIGFGIGIPASNLLTSASNQQRRASALSILNFCWGLGAVGTPLALALAQRWNHVRAFVPALSALLLLCWTGLAFTSEVTPQEEEGVFKIEEITSQRRLALALAAMFFLYVGLEASVGGWIATLAERAPLGVRQSWILAPALFWAGLLAGRGLAPLWLRRIPERPLTLVGLVVACIGICVLLFSRHRQWIMVTGAVIGCGLAVVFPISVALLSRFREMEKRIAGPMFGMAALGGAALPWFVGVLSTWSGSLQVGFAVPLLAAVLLVWLHAMENQGSAPGR